MRVHSFITMSYLKLALFFLLFVLWYPKYTSGFLISTTDCEQYQFWGNCNKDAMCLCHSGLWYTSSVSSIKEVPNTWVNSFSDICTCYGGGSTQKCIHPALYDTVSTPLLISMKMEQADEARCTALLADDPTTTTEAQISTTVIQTVEGQTETTSSTSATTTTQTLTSSESSTTNQITTSAIITTFTSEMTTSITDETQTSLEEKPTSTDTTMCPCSCDYMDKIEYWRNETNQVRQYHELSQRLALLKRLLSVNTKNLSSTVNKKISADDERPSASVTGYVGAAFIALVLGGIVLTDVPVLIRQTCRLLKDIRKLCVRK